MSQPYDALLIVSFGGPDGPDDVLPFLENVLRGRNVPRERMREVAEHYFKFGGRSPINDQNRALKAALEKELSVHGLQLPVYWGNRNWHPLLTDAIHQMATDGVRRALAFVTSAYSSYSSCRQYRENIAAAQAEVGPPAPTIEKLRVFFNHPGFIEPMIESTRAALQMIPAGRRCDAQLFFTAHSIPIAMADNCPYVEQLNEASRLVAKGLEITSWTLAYQSRSGPPQQPWLEPDIGDVLESRHREFPIRDIVVVPIGFISDHMEVLFDLDTEVKQRCERLDINMVRAATAGLHPRFVSMIRELIVERMSDSHPRPALGSLGPSHDICPQECCRYEPQKR
jgi:protoporphyrin/coproporphyrin ferrochelatase